MSELIPVLEELIHQTGQGQSCALCTVVKTKGSTPQNPGASMLLRSDCSTIGTLGGGCVEEEVKRRAHQALTANKPGLFDFVLDHDYGWDDGLICGGRMHIAVMPMTAHAKVADIQDALERARQHQPASIPIVVQHQNERLEFRLHLEVPPRVLIAGAGHVGQAVARLAIDLDFRVTVFDDRKEYASSQRFDPRTELIVDDIARGLHNYPIDPGCYIVIVTRGHSNDHKALEAVIRSDAGYIGLIGSKRKSKMIFKDLRETGVAEELIEGVHTPIGVDIGAVTVPEIAVSIVAELIKHRRKNTPRLIEEVKSER